MHRRGTRLVVGAVLIALAGEGRALANSESEQLRLRGSAELYSLNIDQAQATFRQAAAADADDAAAYRALAGALWIGIAMQRGSLTVDSYLGRVTRQTVKMPPPAPDVASAFQQAVDRAIAIARKNLAGGRDRVSAEYELGSAIGLKASYAATIDGSVIGGFRAAKEAFDAHERVLELNPARHDAGLIVGTYRYLVAALSLPVRLMAYVVGFGGGREKGLQLIEQAAEYHGDNQVDARLALTLIYNREERYDAALRQLATLRAEYPDNRLFWLETGATLIRAGRHAEAERLLDAAITRFAADRRARMFGEEALWYYKRGLARAALGRAADARADLMKATALDGRKWVHGRAYFELGKVAIAANDRVNAREQLRTAIRLCDDDGDGATADAARQLLKRNGL